MGEREVMVSRIVSALNAAMEADPGAITSLLAFRVACNERLADDPHIPVKEAVPGSGAYAIGVLGLLNGALSAAGIPLVAVECKGIDESTGAYRGPVKFVRYVLSPEMED